IVDRFPATVYRNPNADSFIVGISPTGAVLTVMGRSIDGNWWQVQTPLGAGWVNAGEVAFRGEETLVERVGDPGPSFDGPTIRVNADVAVTTQPGSGDVIATLAAGTAVPATGRNADNTWWQVTGVFGIGWIPVSAVSLAGASDYIRVVSDTGVDGPVYTGAAFATAVVEVERKVAYAEGGFSSAPMWAASLGEQLGVIARSPDGLWLRVTKTGFSGWMNFSGLTLQGDMAGIPVYNIFVPATNVAVVNIHRLNIRSGPGAEYDDLTSVPGGTNLNVTGRHPTLPWLRVSGSFGVGWVRIMHIIFRGVWDEVPVVTEPVGSLEIPMAVLEFDRIVYSQPDINLPTGAMLAGGLYNIIGWTADYKWAKIETPSGQVWIPSDQFLVRGTGNNAPVIQ
ncbi:MAG: SH3 domain-containing protein, partial [Chloroflexi bacterium]|nr:SH3 domain-containing protein [Chloroflexota bacterium]